MLNFLLNYCSDNFINMKNKSIKLGKNITVYKHSLQYTHTILEKDYKKNLIKHGSKDIYIDT